MRLPDIARNAPLRFIVLLAAAGALIGALVASVLPPSYAVSMAFTIDARPRPASIDYDYGGYYGLKAAELFTDTLIGWFATPSVIGEMYAEAGIEATDEELADAPKQFNPRRFSSQTVIVHFARKDRDEAARLAEAATAVVEAKTESLNYDESGQSLFIIKSSEPVIASANPTPAHSALIGLLAGAFLAAAVLFFTQTPPKE